MKVRINISISEEANNALNNQQNKSEYIEKLILGGTGITNNNLMDKLINIESIIKSQPRGTASQSIKPEYGDCTCPYETNERGLVERAGTDEECIIHA